MEVLSAFERVNSVALAKTPAPRRMGDVACLVADNQKIVNVLNWTPQHPNLESICRSSFLWEQKFVKQNTLSVDHEITL
jgi:UDP-glucose 4-epimerase